MGDLSALKVTERIALFLADSNDTTLAADAVAATAWYLGQHMRTTPVAIFSTVAFSTLENRLSNREDAASEVLDEVAQFRERVGWHQYPDVADLDLHVRKFDPTVRILACSRVTASELGLRPIAGCRDIYFTPETEASGASLLAYLGLSLVPNSDLWLKQTAVLIDSLHRSTEQKTQVAVFGTGPTYSNLVWSDFDDCANIICNSIVKQTDLFDVIKPIAVCAADPVFHSSYSSYAEEFRRSLIEALRLTGMPFFFPMRDLGVYLSHLPTDLRPQFAPVRLSDREDFAFDISKDLEVKSTANILTLLLLPLAFTLKNHVLIAGCDGKPASSDYFWQHASEAQFGDQMDSVKSLFGGFFEIDYDDYYFNHSNTLGTLLDSAERHGKFARSMTPSYIPSLREREVRVPTGERDLAARRPVVSEFQAFIDTVAVVHPQGLALREDSLGASGLKDSLTTGLGTGYTTAWKRGVPNAAVFSSTNSAGEFLKDQEPAIVIVRDPGLETWSVGKLFPELHWHIMVWESADQLFFKRLVSGHKAPDWQVGEQWTAFGFRSEATSALFASMADARIMA